jgi:tripartite-type tricarboxylate transporter receptor subunit TctC
VVSTGFVINPSLYAKVPYDVIKDFAPVTLVAASPNALTVNPSVPAKTVKELIEVIRANPGKYSYAQPATGSTPHLAGELFKLTYKLDMVMVPFTGAALAVNSTIGGHTPVAFTALPPTISNVKDGKLRGLAVLAAKRSAALPDVPTMAEAGIPDQESDTLTGIVVPAETPKEIIALLQREVAKAVASPDIKDKLLTLGFDPIANSPAEFATRIKVEMAKWAKVVQDAKLKIE